jgi:DNA repair exonuclease SbcCD ATPase subunit
MIFAILTLLSALSISCIAAYFSIIGLATIFPGSIEAVIAMGAALEVGKIIAAIWLHNNWASAPKTIKIYLFSAILVLMGITSMGIFGFLSKSHIEHEANAEKNMALATQVENKIQREKDFILRQKDLISQAENSNQNLNDKSQENINLEQKKIEQLSSQLEKDIELDNKMLIPIQSRIDKLNEELNLVKSKSGGLFSNKKKDLEQITAEQADERLELSKKKSEIEERISKYRNETSSLISDIRKRIQEYQSIGFDKPDEVKNKIEEYNNKITESLNKIDELEKEKFNYDDGSRQLEAEVGPIKYVAELISDFTGVDFDMGKAVRIVIIILIFVFDPLAVLLVLAAHISLMKRFPGLQIDESEVITKNSEFKIISKELEAKELEIKERQKDIEQEEKIIELKESQVNLYKEEIQKYQQSAREAKIEAEKQALEAERNSPIKEEIKTLKAERDEKFRELEQIKISKKRVLDKANNLENDIEEIKQIQIKRKSNEFLISQTKEEANKCSLELVNLKKQLNDLQKEKSNINTENEILIKELNETVNSQNKKIKYLNLKSNEFESKNIDLNNKLKQINELKEFIDQLIKEKEKALNDLNNAREKDVIIKGSDDSGFYVIVPSSIKGCHKFSKEADFSKADILNCQAISAEIDDLCPQQETPLMQKVFDTTVKKYLNDRLDNRSYRKEKPSYCFLLDNI